jgi:hypothetical protein
MAELGTRRVFSNLSAAYFTPWTDESTLGDVVYDLVDIVADTTSIEQADNDISTIDHEFSSTPLFENVSLGEKTFTTECVDFQNAVLQSMFGWDVAGEDAFAPVGYKDLYCKIELHFHNVEDIIVLPKVKLNSRAVIASMKTDVSRANITGTCYPAYIKSGENIKKTDMAVIASANKESYKVAAKEDDFSA